MEIKLFIYFDKMNMCGKVGLVKSFEECGSSGGKFMFLLVSLSRNIPSKFSLNCSRKARAKFPQ